MFLQSGRVLITVISLLVILTASSWWWRKNPAQLLWSDVRQGDGALLSLATGRNPAGKEIIVAVGYFRTDASGHDLRVLCYDAADGRVRWEARENKALPNMMTDPIIAIDPAGDVLVGWETAAARAGANKVVSKYAGSNGHLLWDWSLESRDTGTSMTAIPLPSPSGSGALWVSGIRKTSGEHRRFIAELNPKTGTPLWESDLNTARDGFDRPARIHHLKQGGAIVVSPPRGGEGKFPWIIQYRSSVDGDIRWQHEIVRDNDRSLQGLEWLVDETKGQIVISWNSVTGGRMHFDFEALELTTSSRRWHVRDIIPVDDFISGVEAVTSGPNGGIQIWGRHVKTIIHTKWWRWRMDHGIPYPEQDTEVIEQPLRVTLSPSDGSVRNRELLGRPRERVMTRLAGPGGSADVMILRLFDRGRSNHSDRSRLAPWRAQKIPNELWPETPRREPSGAKSTLDFPNQVSLTPSGSLVIGGDPAEEKREWQIRVW